MLNHGLVLKKVHGLKSYINMNTDLGEKAKNNFKKTFFKLMNNIIFGKIGKCEKKTEIFNLSQQKSQPVCITSKL